MRLPGLRRLGLGGPGCTAEELHLWLTAQGASEVSLEHSGAMAYFRAVKR